MEKKIYFKNNFKLLEMEKATGRTFFPTTQNGRFACKCSFEVSQRPHTLRFYDCVGIHKQFNFPKNFTGNADAMLSLTSAYNAAIQSGCLDSTIPTFLTLDPSELPKVTGASEGIAALLAFIGCIMNEKTMITGFVDTIGMTTATFESLLAMEIKNIDEVKAKAIGAEQCGLKLLIPFGNAEEFGKTLPNHVVAVATVGEALKTIKNMM